MAGFADIFLQMVILFTVGATGYVAKKLHLMDEDFDKKLSKLILSTALPAMILASVLTAEYLPPAADILWAMLVSCLSYVVLIAVGFVVTAALRIPHGRRGVYRFILVFGNTGFLGFPVINTIFGSQALILATIFNLTFNCLVFTVGVWFLAQDNEYGVKVKMNVRAFLSPCIIACLAALVLTFAGVHNVPVVGDALDALGSFTTPAAMLIIGSSLANVPVGQLVGGPRLMAAALFRLLLTPALIWFVFHFFVTDPVLLGVLVVISAMPVATNGTMLSYQYGGDIKTIAQGTFITTVCSLVTIPLLATLLMGM
ncbi:AEC family transporter [Eggerthella sinensis]|uniref:AEC family transporter n=1 Tax=Eggerthella sinensis TaxID=242230 RepID=UPI0022E91D30|nr:AEC family transporter [Eggerthella sinensis]